MVNKIDGNNYYVYPKPQKVNIPDTGGKFSLGYEKNGLQAGLGEKEQVAGQEKQQAAEQGGVRIELSSKGVEKQKQAEAMEHANESGLTSLLETIRTFLTSAVAAVKDIFGKIWNDPQPEDAIEDISEMTAVDPLNNPEVADVTGKMEIAENPDREIQKHLQKGDVEQVIRLLTDNGRKTAARNSTLLTFYDKNGRVVKPDSSVQQRTLYGDRNTIKL